MVELKPLCFILMWFDPSRKLVYNFAIKPAAESCGYRVVRADDLRGPYAIIDAVIEHIFDADIVIADLTGSRPNVFYEMGISHVPGNKTILICDASDWKSIPFDVRGLNVLQYEMTGDGLEILQRDLERHIRTYPDWTPTGNPVQRVRPCRVVHASSFEHFAALERILEVVKQERDEVLEQLDLARLENRRLQEAMMGKEAELSRLEGMYYALMERFSP